MTLLTLVLLAADLDAARLAQIKPRMQSFVDKGDVPGVVTLVEHNGELKHLEAVGWQDREKKIPMKPDTIFEIMSMTKPVTSVAIAMLAEEGKLTLTDKVERHLSEFRGRRETIRDLLTHTSGMPEYGPEATREIYLAYNRTLAEAVALYSQQPSLFAPGEKWQYSNPGMATLGRIVEVVSGMPYEQFCEERIFRPLGMADTFFFPDRVPDKLPRIAMVYQYGERAPKGAPAGDLIYRKGSKYPMPEGGLFSTAADYAKFLRALSTGGKPLISPAMLEVMTADQTGAVKNWWTQGLGFAIDPAKKGFGHGGAFGTHGWAERSTGIVRVFMVQKIGAPVEEIRNAFQNIVNASLH